MKFAPIGGTITTTSVYKGQQFYVTVNIYLGNATSNGGRVWGGPTVRPGFMDPAPSNLAGVPTAAFLRSGIRVRLMRPVLGNG